MQKFLRLVAILGLVVVTTTGCVNRATGSIEASTNLPSLKTMYIKRIPSDEATHALIADKLRSKGVTVTSGLEAAPGNVDAVVTYVDKWMWDMSMYMMELTITLRDPKTDAQLATGNSMHGSLTRKSPKEMVDEVVDNIYKGAK
jgi:hypothetical protein